MKFLKNFIRYALVIFPLFENSLLKSALDKLDQTLPIEEKGTEIILFATLKTPRTLNPKTLPIMMVTKLIL